MGMCWCISVVLESWQSNPPQCVCLQKLSAINGGGLSSFHHNVGHRYFRSLKSREMSFCKFTLHQQAELLHPDYPTVPSPGNVENRVIHCAVSNRKPSDSKVLRIRGDGDANVEHIRPGGKKDESTGRLPGVLGFHVEASLPVCGER